MKRELFNKLDLFLDNLKEKNRSSLLPSLLEAQKIFRYIPEEAAVLIGRKLRVPLADIYGVIEFYSLLYSTPTAETIIRVCTSPLCSQKGSDKIKKALLEKLDLKDSIQLILPVLKILSLKGDLTVFSIL